MKRKGASSVTMVPADILEQLEQGRIETATLTEGLAMDYAKLLANVFPGLPEMALAEMRKSSKEGITVRTRLAAALLLEQLGVAQLPSICRHTSDTIRGFGCCMIALLPMDCQERLEAIKPLADDRHFCVREWAWMAIRDDIASHVEQAITLLHGWTQSTSENIRRFASEATRPRGVWCKHITLLKEKPELGLPLLEPLKSDSSLYVRNSVGNWLNDAAKTRPDWVREVCERWQSESGTTETAFICKKALRSVKG